MATPIGQAKCHGSRRQDDRKNATSSETPPDRTHSPGRPGVALHPLARQLRPARRFAGRQQPAQADQVHRRALPVVQARRACTCNQRRHALEHADARARTWASKPAGRARCCWAPMSTCAPNNGAARNCHTEISKLWEAVCGDHVRCVQVQVRHLAQLVIRCRAAPPYPFGRPVERRCSQ